MTSLVEDFQFIPTSVRAAVSIRNAAEDPNVCETVIESMVGAEPIVAASLLRLANSAAYHRSQSIDSVSAAVRCLGLAHVRSVASHVAMLQLVRGIRGRVARSMAEALLLHSISIAAFGECLAAKGRRHDPARVDTLGLFHELPTFLFLSGSNRQPKQFESREQICALYARTVLRSYEMVMQDLGLPDFAVLHVGEQKLLDRAHRLVVHANPLIADAAAAAAADDALDPDEIQAVQARADESFVRLVEGPMPRAHVHAAHAMPETRGAAADAAPARSGSDLMARLKRRLLGLFGRA